MAGALDFLLAVERLWIAVAAVVSFLVGPQVQI